MADKFKGVGETTNGDDQVIDIETLPSECGTSEVVLHALENATDIDERIAIIRDGYEVSSMGVGEFQFEMKRGVGRYLEDIRDIYVEAILSLLNKRDFLGLQLDLASGSISRDVFFENASQYLGEAVDVDEDILYEKSQLLIGTVPYEFDAETISSVFSCPIWQAEKAILRIQTAQGHLIEDD